MTREEIINLVETTFGIGNYAIKTVSKTDVEKGAYLPNKAQREIMTLFGFMPLHNKHIHIKELFSNRLLTISYYPSERIGSGRSAEIRMGLHDLISYISQGDELLFTHDNHYIFIYNLSKETEYESEDNIDAQVDMTLLKNKASRTNTRPEQVVQTISTYTRNNTVRSYVKRRSNYSCEMPNCNYIAFIKDNGEEYIEVHHVVPLSEGGEDSIYNTVALCPNCHRELHYATNRVELQRILFNFLSTLN